MDRRRFLVTGGTLGTGLLSGCLGGDDDEETETETEDSEPSTPTDSTDSDTATETEDDSDDEPGEIIEENAGNEESDSEETETDTETETGTETETDGPDKEADYVIEVGPDGEPTFSPDSLEIAVTEKVKWVWKSDRHNIIPRKENASWEGTPGEDDDIYYEGYTYEHTFTREGTFEYYCDYHPGMYAEILVTR